MGDSEARGPLAMKKKFEVKSYDEALDIVRDLRDKIIAGEPIKKSDREKAEAALPRLWEQVNLTKQRVSGMGLDEGQLRELHTVVSSICSGSMDSWVHVNFQNLLMEINPLLPKKVRLSDPASEGTLSMVPTLVAPATLTMDYPRMDNFRIVRTSVERDARVIVNPATWAVLGNYSDDPSSLAANAALGSTAQRSRDNATAVRTGTEAAKQLGINSSADIDDLPRNNQLVADFCGGVCRTEQAAQESRERIKEFSRNLKSGNWEAARNSLPTGGLKSDLGNVIDKSTVVRQKPETRGYFRRFGGQLDIQIESGHKRVQAWAEDYLNPNDIMPLAALNLKFYYERTDFAWVREKLVGGELRETRSMSTPVSQRVGTGGAGAVGLSERMVVVADFSFDNERQTLWMMPLLKSPEHGPAEVITWRPTVMPGIAVTFEGLNLRTEALSRWLTFANQQGVTVPPEDFGLSLAFAMKTDRRDTFKAMVVPTPISVIGNKREHGLELRAKVQSPSEGRGDAYVFAEPGGGLAMQKSYVNLSAGLGLRDYGELVAEGMYVPGIAEGDASYLVGANLRARYPTELVEAAGKKIRKWFE